MYVVSMYVVVCYVFACYVAVCYVVIQRLCPSLVESYPRMIIVISQVARVLPSSSLPR